MVMHAGGNHLLFFSFLTATSDEILAIRVSRGGSDILCNIAKFTRIYLLVEVLTFRSFFDSLEDLSF